MTSDKKSIPRLVEICYKSGIRDVVFSPGSRNAPLVIAFNADGRFNLKVIPDERVAAFFALGLSIASQQPTVLCCTSGSAALNYAPAISEAYYQHVPLMVLTADRPSEMIDQGIGQSIRQNNVFANYIKGSYQFLEEVTEERLLIKNDETVSEAIHLSMKGDKGPVHINLPFKEPLYGLEKVDLTNLKIQEIIDVQDELNNSDELIEIWKSSQRKVLIVGLMTPNLSITKKIQQLSESENVLVLSESCSNIRNDNGINCIDKTLVQFKGSEADLSADLLISIGGPIISKKIKKHFQKNKPKHHWCVNESYAQNTYKSLTHHIKYKLESFLDLLLEHQSNNNPDFHEVAKQKVSIVESRADSFLKNCEFSDLKVFDFILNNLPTSLHLHLSNSTVVRYVQLFKQNRNWVYYSNRGVSGIDGSTSTAMGVAAGSIGQHILITGDMSFFYDSNAFWNNHVPNNFKVIVINNGEGNIFKILPHPKKDKTSLPYFTTPHKTSIKKFCDLYEVKYFVAKDETKLKSVFTDFISENDKASVLEIDTSDAENDTILTDYFAFINQFGN